MIDDIDIYDDLKPVLLKRINKKYKYKNKLVVDSSGPWGPKGTIVDILEIEPLFCGKYSHRLIVSNGRRKFRIDICTM